MQAVLDFIIHFDKHLVVVIDHFGSWSYLILFVIIFAETGFVVTPFLPGDSLLFVVGAFSAAGAFNIAAVTVLLMVAAVGGDSINYVIGRYLGKRIVDKKDSRLINRKHLDRTHEFFKKYGGKTIILARFVPIVRTFAPFVAGFIHMDYPRFFLFNVAGGILWVGLFVMGGFFFGNIPVIKENLTLVMLLIVIGSILPGVFEIIRAKRHKA